jgi:hypothetical protein
VIDHRNLGLHTDQAAVEANILRALETFDGRRRGANKSSMGYAGFPTYRFKAPQGAAFSVAKIVRSLEQRGLVRWCGRDETCGHFITRQGQEHLATLKKA